MKEHIIKNCFGTKAKADQAIKALGGTHPKSGGITARHEILMQYTVKQLKELAYN